MSFSSLLDDVHSNKKEQEAFVDTEPNKILEGGISMEISQKKSTKANGNSVHNIDVEFILNMYLLYGTLFTISKFARSFIQTTVFLCIMLIFFC